MKLFWTPASPFTRKVTVSARELGLERDIEIIPTTWPHGWGYSQVPLNRGVRLSGLARLACGFSRWPSSPRALQ
jgi:hypothetical protein